MGKITYPKKGINIISERKTRFGKRIEGTNAARQHFIEYEKNGRVIGRLLRLKGERFWSVYAGDTLLTEPTPSGSKVVGSTDKAKARRLLREKVLERGATGTGLAGGLFGGDISITGGEGLL